MAISGLHIGLAALFGWLCAAGYVALSGANVPAQRGLLALTLWSVVHLLGHDTEPVADFAVVSRAYPCH
ncbi:ComEC/Rec2 family competence protein [Sodalis glossinidius]|uniref:ComEC/Rec2 family competence protein n=1 Tax=Sodalis glossinidius TaxID=63612 RepID=UPI0002ED8076|nr:ComEC/Rec2 family competence protein [Sodalis glossinidius]